MGQWNQDAEKIMIDRFGRDTIIALSTVKDDMPYVRYVNAYYENGTFYIITHALSNKMKHIENNVWNLLVYFHSALKSYTLWIH